MNAITPPPDASDARDAEDVDGLTEGVGRALGMLTDFQRATVDAVYERLFVEGRPRMLVADEVGLGKTIVAKGLIAQRLADRRAAGDPTPFRVTYIASNQVIGRENLRKLNVLPGREAPSDGAERITYLALKPEGEDGGALRLSSLSPGTSFRVGRSTGEQGERKILYAILMRDPLLADVPEGLACLLRGGVRQPPAEWAEHLEERRRTQEGLRLRDGLADRYLDRLRSERVEPTERLSVELGAGPGATLYDALVESVCRQTEANYKAFKPSSRDLVSQLRAALADECLEFLDADLYVLDEFQRFKDLIDGNDESDAGRIAAKIFGTPGTKVLLLSATPFKAFTGADASESGDEHYREFRTVLRFLLGEDADAELPRYERSRQALYKQLLTYEPDGSPVDSTHREAVESVLRTVMCRTERLSVSKQGDAMIRDRRKEAGAAAPLTDEDVRSFLAADRAVRAADEAGGRRAGRLHAPVEFCKSVPHVLSFADGYQLKDCLAERKADPAVRDALRASDAAWLDLDRMDAYGPPPGESPDCSTSHGRLSRLTAEALPRPAELLLWVPPSLPYHPLGGPFADAAGFTKSLLFSGWRMVPRAVASLLSYEAERRTIGDPASRTPQEREERRYFRSKDDRPHPAPQLTFTRTPTGEPASMTNFALLYPSLTLADAVDPAAAAGTGARAEDLEAASAAFCWDLFVRGGLEQFAHSDGASERWYWAAPVLLDGLSDERRSVMEAWLPGRAAGERTASESDSADSSWSDHVRLLARLLDDPGGLGLGPVPDDLFRVLGRMALASPAIALLRSLRAVYGPDDVLHCDLAFGAARGLLPAFNKPEAVAAVRLAVRESVPADAAHWRKVLRYAADGCLQAVFDEYFHLLKPDCPTAESAVEILTDAASINTTSIKVDDRRGFETGEKRSLRCHLAVELGKQRIETAEGINRVVSVRHSFNSPFRPFVLATTSIGQEGLDFHRYCRKVVHWNLPSNPIDLEQREGRVNRYKSHAVRAQVADRYGPTLSADDRTTGGVWDRLFDLAAVGERGRDLDGCDLVPCWHVEGDGSGRHMIERIVLMYPYSRDWKKLDSLLGTLAIYRLAFGQPRQSELADRLRGQFSPEQLEKIRDALMIDLSPINFHGPRGA